MPADLSIEAISSRLATRWVGCTLSYAAEVDSTNARVSQMATQGSPHGTVLVADTQTKGRGRLDRSWHSPSGLNLYFSVLLRPDWETGQIPPLSLAVGIAVAEASRSFLPQDPSLKWPNDVLIEGRKLAGILIETNVGRAGSRFAIVGIGLNVNQVEFPPELAEVASSLALATGLRFDRAEVLATVLERLEFWVDRLDQDGTETIVDAWQKYSSWIGKRIKVRNGDHELSGTALGLNRDGALRILDDHGAEHVVVAGDASSG